MTPLGRTRHAVVASRSRLFLGVDVPLLIMVACFMCVLSQRKHSLPPAPIMSESKESRRSGFCSGPLGVRHASHHAGAHTRVTKHVTACLEAS